MAALADTAARPFVEHLTCNIKDATSDNSAGEAAPSQQPTKQPAAEVATCIAHVDSKDVHCTAFNHECSDSPHMDAQQYLFDASAAYDTRKPTFLLLEDDEETDQQQQWQQQRQKQQQQGYEHAWQQQQRGEDEEEEGQQRQQQRQQQPNTMSCLDLDNAASNDSTSFLELTHCEGLGHDGSCPAATKPEPDRQLYRLVLIDDTTGQPLRPATEEDAQKLARLMSSSCESGADGSGVCSWPPFHMEGGSEGSEGDEEGGAGGSHDSQRSMEVVSGLAHAAGAQAATAAVPGQQPLRPFHHKAGGPCNHCGVKDSPQWRRGPSNKPILCNACGTRYRRTNQLGAPIPSNGKAANRKRAHGGGGSRRPAMPKAPKAAKRAAGASPSG